MLRRMYFVLDEHGEPVPCDDVIAWAKWFEENSARRIVARTDVRPNVLVSTVFLGLDHSFGLGPPQLFETMIFVDGHGDECWRYATLFEAEQGHERAVAVVRAR